MLSIHYNHSAMLAQQHMARSYSAMGQAIERLASGKRINSAKDDPAGYAIANRMTANIQGLTQAARNANDAISMIQTAEGAMHEINTLLHRIRELSVQALSDTHQTIDKVSIQQEINQYLEQIDLIATQSHFNGKLLLNSGDEPISIQVGAHDGQLLPVSFSSMRRADLGLADFSLITKDGISATDKPLAALDKALEQINSQRSYLGAMHNRFESVIRHNHTMIGSLSAARSRIEDADYAAETSALLRAQIQQQVATLVLTQANQTPQLILTLLRESLRD